MAKSIEEAMMKLQQNLAQTFRDLPAIIGEEAVNFSLDAFDSESWDGKPWEKRKNPNKWGKEDDTGRKLLVQTAKLKRSIRISQIVEDKVRLSIGGADIPYARVHNDGFKGVVNQKVREHTRKTKDGKSIQVSAFARAINQDIPQRQFVGKSPFLTARIKKIVMQEIFKNLK